MFTLWFFVFSLSEEVLNRLIALTKAQGDAIDIKVGVHHGVVICLNSRIHRNREIFTAQLLGCFRWSPFQY